MLQKIKKFFLITVLSILLYSCQGAQDVIQGKKRSDTNEEFLVEKKNPLMMPPDYDELPLPVDEENNTKLEKQDDNELIKLLESNNKMDSDEVNENSNLEKSIIEKISK